MDNSETKNKAENLGSDPVSFGNSRPDVKFTEPSPDTQRAFRDALGQFSTGVTIITALQEGKPFGITVNSFASVSLDPALVLWSLSKSSGRGKVFRNAEQFAVHVLSKDQKDLAMKFCSDPNSFDHCEWQYSQSNLPLISNCLAQFECEIHAQHDGGDHFIIVGKVVRFTMGEGESLVFSGGSFGRFSAK